MKISIGFLFEGGSFARVADYIPSCSCFRGLNPRRLWTFLPMGRAAPWGLDGDGAGGGGKNLLFRISRFACRRIYLPFVSQRDSAPLSKTWRISGHNRRDRRPFSSFASSPRETNEAGSMLAKRKKNTYTHTYLLGPLKKGKKKIEQKERKVEKSAPERKKRKRKEKKRKEKVRREIKNKKGGLPRWMMTFNRKINKINELNK